MNKARFAETRFANDRGHLALSPPGLGCEALELLQFGVATDEARQSARSQCLEPTFCWLGANELVHELAAGSIRGLQRSDLDMTFHKSERLGTYEQGARRRHVSEASSQMCSRADHPVLAIATVLDQAGDDRA